MAGNRKLHYWVRSLAATAAALAVTIALSPFQEIRAVTQPWRQASHERMVVDYTIQPRREGDRSRERTESLEAYHSVEQFKLGLVADAPRYCYIVAPGLDNVPTMLAGRDLGSGVRRLQAGFEAVFPSDDWFILADDLYDVPFSIVLSKTELRSPELFSRRRGQRFNLREQRAWAAFREQYLIEPAVRRLVDRDGATAVRIELDAATRDIVVFDVPLHRLIR